LDKLATYQPRRPSRHESVSVRGLDYHLTRWGPEAGALDAPVVLLHGWLDTGGTFQFMVDCFEHERPLVAFDWRGFGRSEWPQEGYVFTDYLGDLDALLEQLSPHRPVQLVGHSMGANVALHYAGLRPERVRSFVNIEGFGIARRKPMETLKQLRKWLKQLKSPLLEKEYNSYEQLTAVINYRYPRLSAAQAAFVAQNWGNLNEAGRVSLAADPRHHWVNPFYFRREDAEEVWSEIRAPMLMLIGAESEYLERLGEDGTLEAVHRTFPGVQTHTIPAAGHMLHIEKPEVIAPLVEAFLDAHA
jgi:pimeloyl-ACP methyl ester carboxylesterase